MDRLVRKIKKEKKNVKGHKRHCLKLLCKPQAVIEMCLLSRHVITWKEVQPKSHVCHEKHKQRHTQQTYYHRLPNSLIKKHQDLVDPFEVLLLQRATGSDVFKFATAARWQKNRGL